MSSPANQRAKYEGVGIVYEVPNDEVGAVLEMKWQIIRHLSSAYVRKVALTAMKFTAVRIISVNCYSYAVMVYYCLSAALCAYTSTRRFNFRTTSISLLKYMYYAEMFFCDTSWTDLNKIYSI